MLIYNALRSPAQTHGLGLNTCSDLSAQLALTQPTGTRQSEAPAACTLSRGTRSLFCCARVSFWTKWGLHPSDELRVKQVS